MYEMVGDEEDAQWLRPWRDLKPVTLEIPRYVGVCGDAQSLRPWRYVKSVTLEISRNV